MAEHWLAWLIQFSLIFLKKESKMKSRNEKRCQRKAITLDHIALRELRQELSLTLKEAGDKLSLSSKSIGAIENGRVGLDRKRIEEIVNSYGLTYLDFLRVRKLLEKNQFKRARRVTIKKVLKNSDRRSYQRIITKECKVLRSMRRIKKISQDEASALCGYPRASIGHIENGRIEITRERAKHIVESYGYKYSEYEVNLTKAELRDTIIDLCLEKIEALDDSKLDVVKNLLRNLN